MSAARRALVALAIVIGAVAWSSTSTSTASPAPSLPDGAYIGDVRTLHGLEGVVAVDFVGTGAEVLVEAGGLADLDLLDRSPRPFLIVLLDGVIVSVETVDDALAASRDPRLSTTRWLYVS